LLPQLKFHRPLTDEWSETARLFGVAEIGPESQKDPIQQPLARLLSHTPTIPEEIVRPGASGAAARKDSG